MHKYKKLTQLNSKHSPSTGNVTAFYGKSPWDKIKGAYFFLQISDCHSSIRLHNTSLDTLESFIKKLKRLRNSINDFITFLEKQ